MLEKKKVIVVVGPTASGKTKLSVDLCKDLNGEVISADSMQVYKDISVISAKPTVDEMCGIKHHLMGFLDTDSTFNVSVFKKLAEISINGILNSSKIPVICGGTGLYIDSLINNIEFCESTENLSVRRKYEDMLNEKGSEYIYNLLKEKDSDICSIIHKNNTVKVIRALEVIETTGMTMTDVRKNAILNESKYTPIFIGLNYRDRSVLYDRINKRVELMVSNGLIDEAKKLYNTKNVERTIKQAIGYKELVPYLNGEVGLDIAIDDIKKYSRRYAKRQITWFKRNSRINWFYVDDFCDYDKLYNSVLKLCENRI